MVKHLLAFLILLLVTSSVSSGVAQENSEQRPLRDLNGYFPFMVPATLEAWESRKTDLQRNLRISLGLLPYPERCPLNATIHGLIDQGEYTIEKVYFESLPGFFVTGNLYRPKNQAGKLPGVISPHGHFPKGRFGEQSADAIKKDMDSGAETFLSNAKNKLQSRSANLAKMGCVVFLYDMIGYADSQQISFDVAHRFGKQRPEMTDAKSWGLFSPQAESQLQNVMGLQAWNSIRALDFIESLPDVDPNRIGVTGASGGGTQTFIVCALDDRPAAAFPAVMVSTAMQGGCTCENCSYLRIGTGNVELAAMFAPKPMGLTAANDWTKEMETKGFPELQKLYELYGKRENVELNARIEFGHNYNQVSREAMYRWFKQHLNFAGEPKETEIEFMAPERLTVFDDSHPRPQGGPEFEIQLLTGLASPETRKIESLQTQIINRILEDSEMLRKDESQAGSMDRRAVFRRLHSNFRSMPDSLRASVENLLVFNNQETADFTAMVMELAEVANGATGPFASEVVESSINNLPEVLYEFNSAKEPSTSSVRTIAGGSAAQVLLIDSDGYELLNKAHSQHGFVTACLDRKMDVAVFQNGWMQDIDQKQTRRVNNPREALAYTVGYNAPQLARRANAWAKVPEFVFGDASDGTQPLFVVSLDRAGLEIALNGQQLAAQKRVAGIVINTDSFRFQNIKDIRDPDLLPGASKYGDLPGLLSLAAPKPMLLIGEDEASAAMVAQAYEAAGESDKLTFLKTIPDGNSEEDVILDWIEQQVGQQSK